MEGCGGLRGRERGCMKWRGIWRNVFVFAG